MGQGGIGLLVHGILQRPGIELNKLCKKHKINL